MNSSFRQINGEFWPLLSAFGSAGSEVGSVHPFYAASCSRTRPRFVAPQRPRQRARCQGVPQDYAEAAKWFGKAADQGEAKAQFNLGVMYDNGYGVSQDYVQAHMWYNLAEAQGRTAAARNRGRVAKLMTPAQIAEAQRRVGKWRPRRQSGAAPDN